MGTIPSSFLPPRALWPERVYTRRELFEFCRDKVAVYKLPREVQFVPQLPRAPGPAGPGTGKLLRRVLRGQAGRA